MTISMRIHRTSSNEGVDVAGQRRPPGPLVQEVQGAIYSRVAYQFGGMDPRKNLKTHRLRDEESVPGRSLRDDSEFSASCMQSARRPLAHWKMKKGLGWVIWVQQNMGRHEHYVKSPKCSLHLFGPDVQRGEM